MSISWLRSERTPALLVRPPGAVSLDEAHAAIEQWEFYSGRTLDVDQRVAVELMMAETAGGRWAARSTGRTVPRQNGKGDELEVVEAWGLTQRGEAIMHTAHEIPTAKSAHARLAGLLQGHKDLDRMVRQVRYANGDQQIEMHNGGIIVYRTRTSGGARGLDDISRLVVDEAQHAQPEQLASSTPIMAVNPNPQTNFTGSAGIEGKSAWWWDLRKRALRADPGAFAWLEHAASVPELGADGVVRAPKPDVYDREAWRAANPAFPHRIEEEWLLEQLRLLGPDLFAREHLGLWDPDPGSDGRSVFDAGVWEAVCAPSVARPVAGVVFAVDVNPERNRAAVASAGGGGTCSLMDERAGVGWAVDEVVRLAKAAGASVAIAARGPAGTLIADIERAGVSVHALSQTDLATACGWFFTAVAEQTIRVRRDDRLDSAVRSAVRKPTGGDGFVWDRLEGEITPLVALTIAAWVAQTPPTESKPVFAF